MAGNLPPLRHVHRPAREDNGESTTDDSDHGSTGGSYSSESDSEDESGVDVDHDEDFVDDEMPSHMSMSSVGRPETNPSAKSLDDKAEEFRQITGIDDLSECVARIISSNGNLESALQAHFENLDRQPKPHTSAPRSTSVSSRRGVGGGGGGSALEDAEVSWFPRLQTFGILDILTYPLSVGFNIVQLFLTGRRGGMRRAWTFEQELDESYPDVRLPERIEGTFEAALAQCKEELVPLVVYLHAPHHGDSEGFVREVLSADRFVACVDDQACFYADTLRTRSGVLLEEALESSSYPFLAVISCAQKRMQVIERIECGGCDKLSLDYVMGKLSDAMERGTANLVEERRQRQERHASQSLREEQDAAFQASLREDAAKAQRGREAKAELERQEEAKRREEEETERLHELHLAELERKRKELPKQPDASNPDSCKLVVKLPDGTRLTRRFLKTHTLQMLHNFVSTTKETLVNFTLNNTHPKKVHNLEHTFEEAKLFPSALLMVHDLDA